MRCERDTTADFPRALSLTDVNADGRLDVLVAALLSDSVRTYQQGGGATFESQTILRNAERVRGVFTADLDGDGDQDVLFAAQGVPNESGPPLNLDKVGWLENERDGTSFVEHVVSTMADGPTWVHAADLDRDGDLDFLSASLEDGKIAWYENQGSDFGDAPAPYANAARHVATGPILGEVRDAEPASQPDAAARGDDVTERDDEDGVRFEFAPRVGQLDAVVQVTVSHAPDGARLDAWIDFDRDGTWSGPREQIADGLRVVEGVNTLTFDVPGWARSGPTFARFRLSTAGGLGLSGVAADGEVEDHAVEIAVPVPTADHFVKRIIGVDPSRDFGMAVADFDGDGRLDAAGADEGINWFRNLGGGTFGPAQEVASSSQVRFVNSLFADDVDGDGDMDLVSAEFGNQIQWHENLGAGLWSSHLVAAGTREAAFAITADVDGDGDRDVIHASEFDNTVAWHENNGQQQFTVHTVTTAALGVVSVHAVDIDSDGDIDILSASREDNTIAWYENNGAAVPQFTQRIVGTVDQASWVFGADLDGNGTTDVVSSGLDGTLRWHRNNGNEQFTEFSIATGLGKLKHVFVTDVDGDDILDVLATALDTNLVALFENVGGGSFSRQDLTTDALGANAVTAGDVDGDGDLDVVAISRNDGNLFWFENALFDFGDAPIGNPRHNAAGPKLGDQRDAEPAMLSRLDALGDDRDGLDDEDGVAFSRLRAGQPATAFVIVRDAPAGARLDAWVDWNGDQTFSDQERLFDSVKVLNDENTLRFRVPDVVPLGSVFARFRLSTTGGLTPTNVARDGEVEDYRLEILPPLSNDFGDAPAPYPTFERSAGASHLAFGPMLGTTRDVEADGQPDRAATGDDLNGSPDDEDGVNFSGALHVGQLDAEVTVTVNGAPAGALLDAWIDFDGDGTWSGPGENILDSVFVENGENTLRFDVPSWSDVGTTFARFRLSTIGELGPRGAAIDGEVEDTTVVIQPAALQAGDFFVQHIISTNADEAIRVAAADLDGDGDLDALSASVADDAIVWYENDGNETFTKRPINRPDPDADPANATHGDLNGPRSLVTADFDGEGSLDVAVISGFDDKVAWYRNDGSQVFSQHIINTPNGDVDNPSSLFVADMDGDGDFDLVVTSVENDRIAWYENLVAFGVNAEWPVHLVSDAIDGPLSVHAADLSNDGHLDLIVGTGSKLLLLVNDGRQQFTEQVLSPTGSHFSVFTADLDGDGDLDILSAEVTQERILAFHNAAGLFLEQTVSIAVDEPLAVFAADVDGDGDQDVLSASRHSGVALHENRQFSQFHDIVVADRIDAALATSVFVADVNGDGDLDVMSASAIDDKIAWYEFLPRDFGDAPYPYPTRAIGNGARHGAIGPTLGAERDTELDALGLVTADGDDVTGIDDEDAVTFPRNPRIGQADAEVVVRVANVSGAARLDAWIDFDADGNWGGALEQIAESVTVVNGDHRLKFFVPSWAVAGETFARFRISFAGGLGLTGASRDGEVEDIAVTIEKPAESSGAFLREQIVTTSARGANGLFAADLDRDGDTDLVSSSALDDKIAWYANDSSGNFTTRLVNEPDTDGDSINGVNGSVNGPIAVIVADLDDDGFWDVVSTSRFDDRVVWHRNDGRQNFAPIEIGVVEGAEGLQAADLDQDGDMDVLATSNLPGGIVWFEQTGFQTFSRHDISAQVPFATSVQAADMDRDGDLDLVAGVANRVLWYENDGARNFTAREVASGVGPVAAVFAADVNRDGRLDVVAALSERGEVVWFEAAGSSFVPHSLTEDAPGARSVFVGDVDGDGDPDVVSASEFDHTIAWYRNDGAGAFVERIVATSAREATFVVAADLDRDGDLDIASASAADNKVAWYRGELADFGDAPDSYRTTANAGGPFHANRGPQLGSLRDGEPDGLPSAAADGDDSLGGDDEAGVTFGSELRAGDVFSRITVNVEQAGGGARLDAWIDFDRNGAFDVPGEEIATTGSSGTAPTKSCSPFPGTP